MKELPKYLSDDRASELDFLIQSLERQRLELLRRMADIEKRTLDLKRERSGLNIVEVRRALRTTLALELRVPPDMLGLNDA